MKKIISNMTIGVITLVFVNSYSFAQNFSRSSYKQNAVSPSPDERFDNVSERNDDKPQKATIKKLKADLKAARINFKVHNDFNRNYAGATDVSWFTDKDAIAVSFKIGALRSHVVYDKNGNRMHTILNYYEGGLPQHIRQMVKGTYQNLNISLVQEILEDGVQVYKIHLEDDAFMKQILICNEEITEYQNFKKRA